ncbi:MAG TPA: DUF6285 domain-containing protein [Acidimicrobiales bacterium]|jgi:uncharacterized protein DUF6285|nr:DUF6285 domain-containing protein [Acidimicrobiales bacterium]
MTPGDELYGVPRAAQLIEAVIEFLEKDVAGELSGRRRFHLRVAVNALNIVKRQLELNTEHAQTRDETLTALGVSSEKELAETIRAGETQDSADLREALRALVTARLQVNNPVYLETYT